MATFSFYKCVHPGVLFWFLNLIVLTTNTSWVYLWEKRKDTVITVDDIDLNVQSCVP